MERTPELLKNFAARLAELAVSKDGSMMAQLMRVTGFLGDPSAIQPQMSSPDEFDHHPAATATPSLRRVGIWEPKQEDGKTYFVRSKDMIKDWNYWSNMGRIEPKGKSPRVIFMGESVARGYLYDPQYTPAMALEGILRSQLQDTGVEVIDLARTNLGMDVKELAIAALQLQPDAAIIFSGNNWRGCFPPRAADIPYLDSLLRKEGMAGPKRFAERRLEEDVKSLVSEVAKAYENQKVPLVWIIPEFNLADWRDPVLNAPHLSRGANHEWLRKRQAAEDALQAGDLKKASELAEKMVQIDEGMTVAGFYILAECSQRTGDLALARHYLEQARDSVIWDSSKSASPRVYSVTQKTLREKASQCGNDFVDLPAIFAEQLNGEIPGRRMFIDYCHLTAEGIQIAMAAAASCVLRALKGADVPWQVLKSKAPSPAASIQSETSFLAAVHNGHWWQSYELLYHYCSEAIQFSPEIAKVMNYFLDLQSRQAPMLMCQAAEQISALGSPLTQHYLLRYNNQQLDPLLLSAVVNALKTLGIESEQNLNQLRIQEHSVIRKSLDLLDYYYCSAGYQPQEVVWAVPKRDKSIKRENHYFIAFWIESRFAFVGEADCPVHLELTCRLPNPPLNDSIVSVSLNEECIAQLTAGRDWSTWDIVVPGDRARSGVNWLTVKWPMPDFPGLAGYEGVLADLLEDKIPDFYCSFGEIFAFRASDGRITSRPNPVAQELAALASD